MDLNLCYLWLKNGKTPIKRLEISQLKRRGPPRPSNIYFLLKYEFFPVTIFHFLPKRIIFIHQNMVIFQVMICKTTSTTPSHLYHYSNQKSSHIDSVRRITTIREMTQYNFNYNQFYNKNKQIILRNLIISSLMIYRIKSNTPSHLYQ